MQSSTRGPGNVLASQKSHYLLQHAENPVDWKIWNEEALQLAQKENKPIFLSVGYSSCHWCHVMAHESFENAEIAQLLRDHFISIKVDREEFPDVDQYYQQACQYFTQHGGWPLSAFLLPDGRPFFVGTYFPSQSRPGISSFKEVLLELARAFKEEKQLLENNAKGVVQALQKGFTPEKPITLQSHFPAPQQIMEVLEKFKDEKHGGFGEAPKFPHFSFLEWGLEQMLEGMIREKHAEHFIKTLENMLLGGIFDQARGGIHRYSTDAEWRVPHFEKMLYDQAGLIKVLAKLGLLYPSTLVFDALNNTLDYIHSEMQGEQKYFFAAQDADSEGVEGLYFTYSMEEFEDCLNSIEPEINDEQKEKLKKWMMITQKGNYGQGLNVVSFDPNCRQEYLTDEGQTLVRQVRKALLDARKTRIPPATDNKGVASWNFFFLSSLLDVAQYCKIPALRQKSWNLFQKGLDGSYKSFIKNEQGAKILHVTTLESSALYAEDYVFFAELQLRAYEITADPVFKQNVLETLQVIIKEFIDDGKMFTRGRSTYSSGPKENLLPNQILGSYDSSFKSPVATFIGLIRRADLLFPDQQLLEKIHQLMENVKQESLHNPFGCAEALRSLTYPQQAYRVVKVPKTWRENPEFLNLMPYFLPRFVFDYYIDTESIEVKENRWQICSKTSCELTGKGIEDFNQQLTPKKKES